MYLGSHVLVLHASSTVVYLVSAGLHLKSIASLFQHPIPTLCSNYKLLCLRDYLSIRGRMKCEKQSEKLQATDTQLQRMQLCQWQIIFWPLSLSLYGWRFATVTACFLFSCTLQFCDSWRPSSKMLRCSSVWKTAWLFVLLFLLHSLFTFVVYVSVSVTFSLFLYRSLCSHFFFSLHLFMFCSVSLTFSLSLYHLYFHQVFSNGWVLDQTSIFFLVDAFVQRFRDLLEVKCSLAQTEPRTHIQTHTCAHILNSAGPCCWSRCQTYSVPYTSSHVFTLLLPLVSYSWVYLKHSLNAWCFFLISSTVYPCPYLFVIQTVAICHLSCGIALSVLFVLLLLLLSFCYPWHCCGAVSCPAMVHLWGLHCIN